MKYILVDLQINLDYDERILYNFFYINHFSLWIM